MCSPGAADLPVSVQFSVFRRRECCHTLKATRPATQKALAHDGRAALALLRKPELPVPARTGPFLMSLALLWRFSRPAQIQPVSQTDRPGRGPRGDGAGRASVAFRLRLVPEAAQFVPRAEEGPHAE